jgi:hypothetical protein
MPSSAAELGQQPTDLAVAAFDPEAFTDTTLYRPGEVAKIDPRYLHLTTWVLANWRRRGTGPAYIQMTERGHIFYLRRAIAEFLLDNTHVPRTPPMPRARSGC